MNTDKSRSKWIKRLGIVLLLAGAFVILRYVVFRPKPIAIDVYTVKSGKVEETVTNSKAGTVKARRRAQLSPEIGGRVMYLKAKEGERVKAGDLLLRLQDNEYLASLKLTERAAESAEASRREACVAEQLAERDLQRNESLNRQGIVSASVLDQLENQRDAAKARCESGMAEARRAAAAKDVAIANLQKTELHAPFDGVIVQLTTELGEWITPSPPGVPIPPVIDLLDSNTLYVEAPIDETDSGKLHVGQLVRISLDPYPDRTFSGRVTRMADFVSDVEGQNRTLDVEAEFDDREVAQKCLPGMSADIEIILSVKENVPRIPSYALMDGNRVFLIEQDRLVSRTVKPGLRNWEYVEIVDGLKNGDRITVSLDRADVKEGVRVRVGGEVNR